ncbi:WD repeat-containing protein 6-like [Mya arenaria]|uniref:WD repeat-containing protein 6-like n=1 Tax=Mya arenaria TaxID=6604 RepID=UPI0022E8004F|nr:WD repeat-containing protein 6-like [Mya arenaria]XP_052770440.1 WD repeat-containing protein 6-like [Mya arenaria]XP_052770441.1 WD repeat-containing protein 6-like [Mya arenaria]XP_052770442.1 WD repeat-containing protein 6-like [Mya arenaria]XP_052770443.1 WD repeat-containing protein 6-like [Mya arenaria]
MHLESEFYTGPVTALWCNRNFLLAGLGSYVWVYTLEDRGLIQRIDVLPARVVHGFIQDPQNDRHVCVYGQKSLRVLHQDSCTGQLTCTGKLMELHDWIWDVGWIEGSGQLCVALGHNEVATVDIARGQILTSVHCWDKCILYCGRFLACSPGCIVLAAGTVFNHVVIWSPHSIKETDGTVKPFHTLTGHQGVIFNVDYSPSLQLICSVSDDRSIQLYRVKFAQPMTTTDLDIWKTVDCSLIHTLYGHSARVWDGKLLDDCIVSVGEDSTLCVWSYEGQIIQKLKGHKGKSIWSLCAGKGNNTDIKGGNQEYSKGRNSVVNREGIQDQSMASNSSYLKVKGDEENRESNLVFTGGGDNSIRMWRLQNQQEVHLKNETHTLNLQLDSPDFPRNTLLLDVHRVIVITNAGHLLMYHHLTNQRQVLMSDDKFASYTELSVSQCKSFIAIGNIRGTLRVIDITDSKSVTQTDVQACEGKILSIVWLDTSILLTTGPSGIMDMWKYSGHSLTGFSQCELPHSKQRFVTSATLVDHLDNQMLVCGDKMGSVYVYILDFNEKKGTLVHTFPRLHGRAGVTHICCHGNHIYSAGRDGTYRVYEWAEDDELVLLNSNKVCKGMDWIERLEFSDDSSEDIQVLGFYTDLFVVWSVQQNQKLLEVNCGGGHRAWDFCRHGNTATFVYVKAREVKVTKVATESNQFILKGSLHGRELCDAKHVASGQDTDGNPVHALVTCSEDTAVCLAFLHYENGFPTLKVSHTLTSHISSVRCLAVCQSSIQSQHSSANRKLIFSAGGRAQLQIWRTDVKFNQDFDTCSSNTFTKEGANSSEGRQFFQDADTAFNKETHSDEMVSSPNFYHESLCGLQLSQIGKRVKKPWRFPVENSDPETRILDLTVIQQESSPSLFLIGAACSDGIVRLLSFNEESRNISIIATSTCGSHCILKVGHVIIPSQLDCIVPLPSNQQRILLLSAAADGYVSFWDVTKYCGSLNGSESCLSESVENDCSESLSNGTSDVVDNLNTLVNEEGSSPHKESRDCKIGSDVQDTRNNSKHDTYRSRSSENLSSNGSLSPLQRINVHQSGINSLQLIKHGNMYMLLTGGDDNAIKVTLVAIETIIESKVKVMKSGGHLSANSAQITGIWSLTDDLLLSASIDQRLCVWKLDVTEDKLQLQFINAYYTSVSDVANIDVWKQGEKCFVLVCGVGLELVVVSEEMTGTDCSSVKLDS